jgi:hypothetical protein
VLVLRRVAAADVAAAHADPQVDPDVAHRQALLAPLSAGRHRPRLAFISAKATLFALLPEMIKVNKVKY